MRRAILLLTMITAALLVASGVALAAAGSLDLSFGRGDGKVFTNPYDTEIKVNASAEDIIVQPNGKLVAAGTVEYSPSAFGLVRYNPDGTLDKSFSDDGRLVTRWRDQAGDTEIARAYAVAAQPDRKLIAGGEVGSDFGLVRYNPAGSIDKTFGGGDGRVTTNFGSDGSDPYDSDTLRALIVQPDGKIVAVGTSEDFDCSNETGACTRDGHFALARYNSDGTRDKSFGDAGNGKILTDVGPGMDMGSDVVLQSDGKLVVSGTYSKEDDSQEPGRAPAGLALVRYNTDGSLDLSFGGGDGKVTSDAAFSGENAALALRPDGRFVAAGMTPQTATDRTNVNFILAAFEPDGSPDAGFGGGDGVVKTSITGGADAALDLVVQADDKPVAAGYADPEPYNAGDFKKDFALVRYNPDGSLDDTFGGDGKVRTNMKRIDEANALALQPDGRLVAAGASYKPVDGGGDSCNPACNQVPLGTFAVARYESQ